jgi:hypothetical protein
MAFSFPRLSLARWHPTSGEGSYGIAGSYTGVGTSAAQIILTNSTFQGGKTQLVLATGDVVVRGCKFSNYEQYGIYVNQSDIALDLGNATEPGNNEFTGSKAGGVYGLFDYRNGATSNQITVSATKFNGEIPPAGTVTKPPSSGCTGVAGAYCIEVEGHSIIFY